MCLHESAVGPDRVLTRVSQVAYHKGLGGLTVTHLQLKPWLCETINELYVDVEASCVQSRQYEGTFKPGTARSIKQMAMGWVIDTNTLTFVLWRHTKGMLISP